jgi:hypothetical protein
MFLRNVSWFSRTTKRYSPEDVILVEDCSENCKEICHCWNVAQRGTTILECISDQGLVSPKAFPQVTLGEHGSHIGFPPSLGSGFHNLANVGGLVRNAGSMGEGGPRFRQVHDFLCANRARPLPSERYETFTWLVEANFINTGPERWPSVMDSFIIRQKTPSFVAATRNKQRSQVLSKSHNVSRPDRGGSAVCSTRHFCPLEQCDCEYECQQRRYVFTHVRKLSFSVLYSHVCTKVLRRARRHIGLWDVEDPSMSRQSVHGCGLGCQPCEPAAL